MHNSSQQVRIQQIFSSLRLAFVHPSFMQQGGAENYLIDAMRGLAARGHEVVLFTVGYDESIYPAPKISGFRVERLGGRGFMEGIGGTLQQIQRLSTLLRGFDRCIAVNFPATLWTALGWHGVPVIWLCMEPKRNLYPKIMYMEAQGFLEHGYRIASDYQGFSQKLLLLLRDPHVLMPYNMRAVLQRFLDQRAVARTEQIYAISPYIAGKVKQIYDHPAIHIVWAGIPVPSLAPNTPPDPLILIPTRLEPIKNVETVLKAMAVIRQQLESYRVIIVGTGSDEARLRKLTVDLDLTRIVTFTGYISAVERDSLYAHCAFVLYPSLAEPLGLPCAEAALFGKAVIAAHQGGPADLVRDGETGLLVNMQSPDDVGNAILQLISNAQETALMGQRGRERIEMLIGLPNWITRFETLLSDSSQPRIDHT